ncbi:uncharacterized protein LOC135104038 [Scylla paramamosain]|uniref:uncharacterized protein LOC135104038 n=1 Tax=Scylla paramamosain TaxID=85552 RepID=UPI0030829586
MNSETSSVRPLQWDLSGTSSVGLSSVTLPGGWCCNSVGCPWWDLLGGTSLVGPPSVGPSESDAPLWGLVFTPHRLSSRLLSSPSISEYNTKSSRDLCTTPRREGK